MRGRKPTPTFLKLVTGNPGRRPLNDAEPIAPATLPEPPPTLSTEALAEWNRLGPLLVDANLLANLDRNVFASYCMQFSIWSQASKDLAVSGLYMKSPSGRLVISKCYELMRDAEKRMTSIGEQLGLSPSARSRIRVDDKKPKDEFESYLNRGPDKAPRS